MRITWSFIILKMIAYIIGKNELLNPKTLNHYFKGSFVGFIIYIKKKKK